MGKVSSSSSFQTSRIAVLLWVAAVPRAAAYTQLAPRPFGVVEQRGHHPTALGYVNGRPEDDYYYYDTRQQDPMFQEQAPMARYGESPYNTYYGYDAAALDAFPYHEQLGYGGDTMDGYTRGDESPYDYGRVGDQRYQVWNDRAPLVGPGGGAMMMEPPRRRDLYVGPRGEQDEYPYYDALSSLPVERYGRTTVGEYDLPRDYRYNNRESSLLGEPIMTPGTTNAMERSYAYRGPTELYHTSIPSQQYYSYADSYDPLQQKQNYYPATSFYNNRGPSSYDAEREYYPSDVDYVGGEEDDVWY